MIKTSDAQVHVHCIANLRVSAFLYKYWKDMKGMDENQARKLMDSVWRPGGVWALGKKIKLIFLQYTGDFNIRLCGHSRR